MLASGRGGGVGVVCPLTEAAVPGLIPSGICLYTKFPPQFLRHTPWTSAFFFSFCLCLFLNSLVEPHLISSFLFPLEFLCKAVQIKQKVSILCLCTLSLSVLVPSYQDETGVARLQWRHETFGSWAGMITSYIWCFSIENPYILGDKRPFLPTENKSGFCHCLKRSHQVSSRDVVCLTNCFKEFHPITPDISAGLLSKSFYRAFLSVLL